jgi:hypothetical protein
MIDESASIYNPAGGPIRRIGDRERGDDGHEKVDGEPIATLRGRIRAGSERE